MKHPLAVVWIYTLARVAVFAAIFGLLYAFGLQGLLAAALAVLLSVPISFVVLAKPRAALAESVQRRLERRDRAAADLDAQLGGDS